MKKIFALLLMVFALGTTFAQSPLVQVTVIPSAVTFRDTIQYLNLENINYAVEYGIGTNISYYGVSGISTVYVRESLDTLVARGNTMCAALSKFTKINSNNTTGIEFVLNKGFVLSVRRKLNSAAALTKCTIYYNRKNGATTVYNVSDTVPQVVAWWMNRCNDTIAPTTGLAFSDGAVGNLAIKVGADKNNGIYGVSDAQLGFAVEGALVGGANATGLFTDIISEQTSTAGVTVDGALIKDGGITANSQYAVFIPTGAPQALSGAGAINLTANVTKWTSTGTGDALTLANGSQIGQSKTIRYVAEGAGGDTGVLTLTGYTSITFNAVGDSVILVWNGTAWKEADSVGVTVAP